MILGILIVLGLLVVHAFLQACEVHRLEKMLKEERDEVKRLTDAIARANKVPVSRPIERGQTLTGNIEHIKKYLAENPAPYFESKPEIIPSPQ